VTVVDVPTRPLSRLPMKVRLAEYGPTGNRANEATPSHHEAAPGSWMPSCSTPRWHTRRHAMLDEIDEWNA
jgi:hypothetical protein